MALLIGGAAAGLENCPLCGQKLAPGQAEETKLRLEEGLSTKNNLPADGTSS
jgi:hypothetical protein